MHMKTVSIIVPCYNEEQSLPLYFEAVDNVLKDVKDYDVDFILVNDGSKDKTQEVIEDLYNKRDDINYVRLSRNFGQNPALTAGLDASTSDYVIMMDADLQDPVELITAILEAFSQGYEVVSPHRTSRETDGWFKRVTAGAFYKFVNRLEGKQIVPENVNCFRGLSEESSIPSKSFPKRTDFWSEKSHLSDTRPAKSISPDRREAPVLPNTMSPKCLITPSTLFPRRRPNLSTLPSR